MSRSLPSPTTGLLRAWPASALAVWSAAWRAGLASPDDVLHTLHDYAETHDVDTGGTALDLVRLVGAARRSAVVFPAPGDAQGLPSEAEDVLILDRADGPPLALTARGTAERCRWSVRELGPDVDVLALGGDQTAGELEYDLREAVGEAATVIAGLAGPRVGGPADLRDALAARTAAVSLDLPPHDRQRVDRMLATAAQIDAIVELAGGGLGASAQQVENADAQLRRLSTLTRRARAAAINTLLRDYYRD
ncbi:serine/threonine protein kinase [Gordonia alkaliphila]|uniref:serine/threonine protein kinase n=1 Tax=Gordonia alkaliphila TaxID=1053547 RepID=UPI001FF321F1|nr:serine/threonine protein kinase [Gordonia alkaliphila]MCK0440632.1 serine/threonine protein kinase [Gordonia alkaliphila]